MKNNKLSLLRDQDALSDNTESVLPTDSNSQMSSTNTNHLKGLHAFKDRVNYLREEVNRLSFMMTEIHNIVKTRFQ